MSNREQITKLIKKYSLHADDVFVHEKGWKIIKRRGYKKIQAALDIQINFEVPHAGVNFAVVVAKGTAFRTPDNTSRSTTGEASPDNNTFPYPVAVAQKRAEGRLILEIAGLYEQGFMTEDEIDETVKGAKIKAKAEKVGSTSVQDAMDKLGLSIGKEGKLDSNERKED